MASETPERSERLTELEDIFDSFPNDVCNIAIDMVFFPYDYAATMDYDPIGTNKMIQYLPAGQLEAARKKFEVVKESGLSVFTVTRCFMMSLVPFFETIVVSNPPNTELIKSEEEAEKNLRSVLSRLTRIPDGDSDLLIKSIGSISPLKLSLRDHHKKSDCNVIFEVNNQDYVIIPYVETANRMAKVINEAIEEYPEIQTLEMEVYFLYDEDEDPIS